MTIEALRTRDERFAFMPGYPYAPRYVEDLPGYEGLRLAYVDEIVDEGSVASSSPDAQATFLCLHGEPTWGYLYRKMLPALRFADVPNRCWSPRPVISSRNTANPLHVPRWSISV